MQDRARSAFEAARTFWREWSDDNAGLLAAGVAFYATFSLAPLLALILFAGSLTFGAGAARARLVESAGRFTTPGTAEAIGSLAAALGENATSGVTLLTAVLLLFGASVLFRHLRAALDLVLDVPPSRTPEWLAFLVSRLVAAVMVVAVVFVLFATILLTSALAVVQQFLPDLIVGDVILWRIVDLAVSTVVTGAVFAATLKFVPDVRLKWRHVLPGASTAAILFSLGRLGLAAYLSRSDVTSSYGAAASLAVVLIAIYLAVLVLFAGAEITKLVGARDEAFRRAREEKQRELGRPARESKPEAGG